MWKSTQLANDLHAAGKLLGASPLQSVALGQRAFAFEQGKRLVSDGPFAETREQLGGST